MNWTFISRGDCLTEAKTPPTPKVEVPDPDLMTLEDLDKIISDSDPNALDTIEGVRKIAAEIGHPLEILEPDSYLDTGVANLKKFDGFKGKVKLKAIMFWVWLKSSTVESVRKTATWSVEKRKQAQAASRVYKFWPTKSKLLLQGAIVLFLAAILISYYAFVKKTLFYKQELFITSLESLADKEFDISHDESRETFYNSSRIPKNIFSLKKIVVNIQPSSGSGPNPMVAFEFSLEGSSSEVLLEIKDREGEILDQVQRTVESYSFDELNDIEGKKMISEKVRTTVNRSLTLGKIRKVYIQGIILKP